jgi:GGDEF domain-containing protein
MQLVLGSGDFALGVALGVLGLVLLLSLLVAYAYDESTLLFLAAYIAGGVAIIISGERLHVNMHLVQNLLLVIGPAVVSGLLMRMFRKRTSGLFDKVSIVILMSATLGLLGVFMAISGGFSGAALDNYLRWICFGWGALIGAGFAYRSIQALETAGPWKWWLMLGHAAGLVVALVFLMDLADAKRSYWPVILMLLVQVPPIYLALVWRSRLLNEIRLRSLAANTTDPLTGLATTPVLIEQLMRIMARTQQSRQGKAGSSVLFLVDVHNWQGLLNELGAESNEKLLLESALRLRRSIGDNDMVARISGGRFAVLAQGLADQSEISSLATRLVVSGLRIDSPLLPGVELQFRVIVRPLKLLKPLALQAAEQWLASLVDRFSAWPGSHRSRSILVVEDDAGKPELSALVARH